MLKIIVLLTTLFFFTNIALFAQIGNCGPVDYYHSKVLDNDMHLDSWYKDSNGPFDHLIDLSATWWKNTPDVNSWPGWCTASILDRQYNQSNGSIPGTVCSDAIISCLKYYVYTGDTDYLNMAKKAGDFIIYQDLTPSNFEYYPDFPYAVGNTGNVNPDGSGHPDSMSTLNPEGHIQPGKGAMEGVALLELYKVTGSNKYLNSAVNIANCLSRNAIPGTDMSSPWPMRVMADNGDLIDGAFSANVSFACRLFDGLLRIGQTGNGMYRNTRDSVWNWLKTNVIAFDDASKWKNFFEDHSGNEDNPLQLNALETVRYLLEERNNADPDWFRLAGKIINQVQRRWALTKLEDDGYICIAEQENDKSPYNSHTSRFGSVLAMYYEAGAPDEYKDIAYHSLCYGIYSIEDNGFTNTYYKSEHGAWTSDSFGDFLGHYIDAFAAVPEWAGNKNHLLKSSSTITSIIYKGANMISYSAYDSSGLERLKLISEPISVKVNGLPVYSYSWDKINKILMINRSKGSDVVVTLPVNSFSPNSNSDQESFILYPNPAENELTISTSVKFIKARITVFSIEGKIVMNDVLESVKYTINLSSLKNGIYIMSLSNGSVTLRQKFVKQ